MPLINMPKLSDTMTEGTLVRWLKKKGDAIEMGDILAEVETDKATMEMESFDEGVLTEIYAEEGSKVAIGDRLALILGEGESPDDSKSSESNDSGAEEEIESEITEGAEVRKKKSSPDKKPASQPKATSSSRVKASPLAKKLAAERGVSLDGITGSGPGGRIVAADVPTADSAKKDSKSPATGDPAAKAVRPESTGGGERTIALSGMRRVIADRLLASKTQIPHFYLAVEVDAAPLMRLRKEVNAANEAAGLPKITVNDFVLLATARACVENPKVNAAWAGDSILEYDSVNLCVAVAVDDGLVTPVIRNAQKLSLREISTAVKDLATRARNKKLKPEEYQGGTITVSNLGAYGVEQFYAIVNPPQSAILAIGAIIKKPVVGPGDSIVAGQRMNISLSGDHRVVDGAVGAEFVGTLRRLLENPALMLM